MANTWKHTQEPPDHLSVACFRSFPNSSIELKVSDASSTINQYFC